MAGLYAPLPTLRSHPRGGLRTDRGRRGLLLLHRSGLSPHTPCRSPGALTRVAACTLARSPYFVTRYPKASDISSPPCLLRLLPAGANRRVGLAPTGKRRLVTAHVESGHPGGAKIKSFCTLSLKVAFASQIVVLQALYSMRNYGPPAHILLPDRNSRQWERHLLE